MDGARARTRRRPKLSKQEIQAVHDEAEERRKHIEQRRDHALNEVRARMDAIEQRIVALEEALTPEEIPTIELPVT